MPAGGDSVLEIIVFGSPMKVWELMAVLGILLAALEIIAPGFILLPIGLAFLITAGAALFLNSWLTVLMALVASLAFLIWLFQFKLKLGVPGSVVDTNVDALIGQEVTVTKAIGSTAKSQMGEVKIYGDRFRAYSISKVEYAVDDVARIVKVDGNKIALD